MNYSDNKSTVDDDGSESIHQYSMENNPEYRDKYLGQKIYEKFASEDKKLQDQSMLMLLGSAGLGKIASYSNAPLHTASRVSRAIQYRDPRRLFGIPSNEQMKKFTTDAAARDEILWRASSNGMKFQQLGSAN